MIYRTLPTEISVDGKLYTIRNKGDYGVILDVLRVLNSKELTDEQRAKFALFTFLDGEIDENYRFHGELPKDKSKAVEEMFRFIRCGEDEQDGPKQSYMDWDKDFNLMVSPINKALGMEIRSVPYLHWWTFIGGYNEIGECMFSTVVGIRKKRAKDIKLDKWEQEFYAENCSIVDLEDDGLSEEEREWLNLKR